MNIHLRRGNRPNRPFLHSVEDKSELLEGEEVFHSQYESDQTTGIDCVCTQQVFDTIKDIVGTPEAPALIADANAQTYEGRMNVYIENGSLKILAQS
jgi:hypothetical protein